MAITDVKETIGRALEEARTVFAMDSPVINIIVGVLVLYVVIYFITFYLGPVLFGMRPYHPYFIGRTMHHVTRREATGFDVDADNAELTRKVTSAIQDGKQLFM